MVIFNGLHHEIHGFQILRQPGMFHKFMSTRRFRAGFFSESKHCQIPRVKNVDVQTRVHQRLQ